MSKKAKIIFAIVIVIIIAIVIVILMKKKGTGSNVETTTTSSQTSGISGLFQGGGFGSFLGNAMGGKPKTETPAPKTEPAWDQMATNYLNEA